MNIQKEDNTLKKENIKGEKEALTKSRKFEHAQKKAEKKKAFEKEAELREQRRKEKRENPSFKQKLQEVYDSIEYQVTQIAKEQKYTDFKWHKLDNAALIYPAISYENNSVFRMSVLLNQEIDPLDLQRAVNVTVPRFPTMTSSLRAGLFWYYLDSPAFPLVVKEEKELPCRPFKIDRKSPCVRVMYRKYEIITEFFHSATDGAGGLCFLNSLVATYLRLKGAEIKDRTSCPHGNDLPRPEETVDSFQCVRTEEVKKVKHVKAMHLKGDKLDKGVVIPKKVICESDALKVVCKKYDCTVTHYLSACILQACRMHADITLNKDSKPITLSTPCNLRKIFNSSTLRNFSSYYHTTYKEGTFEELVGHVKEQTICAATKDYFQNMINFNTSAQRNIFMRLVPLFLKNLILKLTHRILGYSLDTYSFSNMGLVSCPQEFKDYILRYDISLGATFGVAVCSYNGLTSMSLNSLLKDTIFERYFVDQLVKDGITVCVETAHGG